MAHRQQEQQHLAGAAAAQDSSSSSSTDKYEVSRAAEDKLTYKLALAAEAKCADLIKQYNECLSGRVLTAAWACKALYKASNGCISEYVNEANIETMKRRWVDAGRPRWPDWPALLDGLVAPEHTGVKPQRPG